MQSKLRELGVCLFLNHGNVYLDIPLLICDEIYNNVEFKCLKLTTQGAATGL